MSGRSLHKGLKKNIHIVPLGFEYERAVAPFEVFSVDKVVIVTDTKSESMKPYINKVLSYFEEKGIDAALEHADIFDIVDTVRVMSSVIKQYADAGDYVRVNVSSCGRLVSIAAYQAGMAHNAEVYYVKADSFTTGKTEQEKFGVSRCSMKEPDITTLPNVPLNTLNEEEVLVLELMFVRKQNNLEWTYNIDIAAVLHEYFPDEFAWDPNNGKNPGKTGTQEYQDYRKGQWNFAPSFGKRIGSSLESRGCIERDPKQKKYVRYRITSIGEYLLFLSGLTGLIGFEDGKVVYREK